MELISNAQLATRVIQNLIAAGVREFCLCAGARNSPFVHLFEKNPQLKVYHFFEERSAAFFALGRIASSRHPVAVITTSGTAAAELLPAAVEGTYSSLPLIMVTADRPKKYRWTGAPQSIEQVGLFSYYIEVSFDLDEQNSHISLNGLSWKKPIHLNVCFKEPLLDEEPLYLPPPTQELRTRFPESFPLNMAEEIENFVDRHRPVVILSTIPEKSKPAVVEFLKHLKIPIYAEGISGLRGHPDLISTTILSGEKMLAKLIDEGHCNAIIRIGGVPTVRFWRDLEDKREDLPVLSLGYNHFTGLSRSVLHFSELDDLPRLDVQKHDDIPSHIYKFDRDRRLGCEEILKKYPHSEPGLLYALSKKLKDQAVYLGNSLPVREWDLAADFAAFPSRVIGNRGANGIDGQVSTFMGWSKPHVENWCLIGDLTALYDLSGLWVAPQLLQRAFRVVVINNGGGMIFHKMFGKEIFLNRHDIDFKNWAGLWKWAYQKWTEIPEVSDLAQLQIIELVPDPAQTTAFWKAWDQLWQA